MNIKRQQTAAQDSTKVDQQKVLPAQEQLHRASKQVEAQQVQEQMPPIRMQERASDQPVVFLPGENTVGPEDKSLLELAAAEPEVGNRAGYQHQQRGAQGDGFAHGFSRY